MVSFMYIVTFNYFHTCYPPLSPLASPSEAPSSHQSPPTFMRAVSPTEISCHCPCEHEWVVIYWSLGNLPVATPLRKVTPLLAGSH